MTTASLTKVTIYLTDGAHLPEFYGRSPEPCPLLRRRRPC